MTIGTIKIFTKIISVIGIIITFSIPRAQADSIYDGIWKLATDEPQYYSIIITKNTALVINIDEVALYENPLLAAYIGPFPESDGLIASAENPLSIRVVTDRLPVGHLISWQINFISKDLATMQRPKKDYPTVELPPPIVLQKIL